jgi:hypothetical protein
MKAFAILPAAAAAIMALSISAVSSQPAACQKEFQACMDGCTTRSSKGLQDSCFTSCEGKNNICSESVYGKRPFNGSPSTAAAQKAQVKDALAKTEKEPEQPQVAEPAPAPAAAPEPRAPARRPAR